MSRWMAMLAAASLLAACEVGSESHEPPMATAPPATVSATASERAESATDLLECDGAPSSIGGRADDFGPEGSGATADEAFDAWIATTAFGVPRAGYEKLGTMGDRSVYAYRAGGRVKVVVVISPRFGEFVNAAFTIEELRTCDPAEYGAGVDLGPGRRAWVHEATGELLTDIAGPGHCGWESARMLHVEVDGAPVRQYLRDPLGVFAGSPSLLDTYAEDVELPNGAAFSGYRTDDGLELWFTTSDTAAYVVTPDGVELWPRADPPIGCA